MTMLQLSGILINSSVRHPPRVTLWLTTQQLVSANSTISNPNVVLDTTLKSTETKGIRKSLVRSNFKKHKIDVRNLFEETDMPKIIKDLFLTIDRSKLTPEYSLQILSQLNDLVKDGKVKITDFSNREMYKALCANISRTPSKNLAAKNMIGQEQSSTAQYGKSFGFLYDMNEIEKITNDPNLPIIHAVQIMSKLAFHKSRVVPVLETLTNHIVQSRQNINIKLSSDILYNMAVLNFYDEVLIGKIASNLVSLIPTLDSKRSAVIGSLLKSIGILRYRNEDLLIELSTWILKNSKSIRPQEISSFLLTLAIVGYNPPVETEKLKEFTDNLKEVDMVKIEDWLEVVWALVVLNLANEAQVLSILDSDFVKRLSDVQKLSETKKRKILNISAVANLIFKKDTGQFLEENPSILDVTLERNKEKQAFLKGIVTSLHALLPSSGCLKINVNTGMGFALDAEFYMDKKGNPVLIDQITSKKEEALRLAVVGQSYFEFCRGNEQIIGPVHFQYELLKLSGYHVILVPYTEFSLNQKVIEQVKYLKDKIKTTLEEC